MPFPTRHSSDVAGALERLRRAHRDGVLGQQTIADPTVDMIQGAIYRTQAQERKNIRITWEEKQDAFDQMGYVPTPKQEEIAKDGHTFRHVRAGGRSGKTLHAAAEACAVMLKKPGSFGWLVSVDYALTRRCWDMLISFLKKLERQGSIKIVVLQEMAMRVEIDNGSRAEGQSANHGEELQGIGLDWLIMDEIATMEPWVLTRIIMPRLLGNKGWALLIGTPLGDPWASKLVRDQNAYADAHGEPHEWVEFLFESWHNTYQFPLGREDPAILLMERTMPYDEFMEQVMAMPQRSRYITFREFIEEVHARDIPFDPKKHRRITLSIDPSTGANPYAVLAIFDGGEHVLVLDEFYKTGVIYQDVIAELADRPWWKFVTDAIMDDAWPQERQTWNRQLSKIRANFRVRSANKPHYIETSLPLVSEWLRDPVKFNASIEPMKQQIVTELFGERGWTWRDLEEADRNRVLIRLELMIKEKPEIALNAARLFMDRRRCHNLINEFHSYSYRKPKSDRNVPEAPIEFNDHGVDCVRYFLYRFKRNYTRGQRKNRTLPTSYMAA